MYRVIWTKPVKKELALISIDLTKRICFKITEYLAKDPINLSEGLKGEFIGKRRYRYGDYRIIFDFKGEGKVIRILRIGHRSEIYL